MAETTSVILRSKRIHDRNIATSKNYAYISYVNVQYKNIPEQQQNKCPNLAKGCTCAGDATPKHHWRIAALGEQDLTSTNRSLLRLGFPGNRLHCTNKESYSKQMKCPPPWKNRKLTVAQKLSKTMQKYGVCELRQRTNVGLDFKLKNLKLLESYLKSLCDSLVWYKTSIVTVLILNWNQFVVVTSIAHISDTFITQRAILQIFCPRGMTSAPLGVKVGMEQSTKFHPHLFCLPSVSYTHLTLPTNREV